MEIGRAHDGGGRHVGAYALCLDEDGRLLLSRIAQGLLDEGRWTLPGGGLEWGESPAACVIRELQEETGLIASPPETVAAVFSHVYAPRPDASGGFHHVGLIYRITEFSGSLRPEANGSTDSCMWIGHDEVGALDLAPLGSFGVDLAWAKDGLAAVHYGVEGMMRRTSAVGMNSGEELKLATKAGLIRLETVVGSLRVDALRRVIGNGWTVAATLGHLAFWDRWVEARWNHFDRTGFFHDLPDDIADLVNEAADREWQSLTPEEAARLCLDAAHSVNRRVQALLSQQIAAALKTKRPAMVDRSIHWYPHIEEIEGSQA